MAPGVPRWEAQQLVCVCANELGDAKDRREPREVARATNGATELALALRLNVTIPRHAGIDNSSFLSRSLNHPNGSGRIDLRGGCPLTLALRQSCLLVQWINWYAIGASVSADV
jgi:hypothetical protein